MTYNVLCITTRKSENDSHPNFHQPAPAETAEVIGHNVNYDGRDYPLTGISSGLCGQATLLMLRDGSGLLELYTDTPTTGSRETSASLREMAEAEMANVRRHAS